MGDNPINVEKLKSNFGTIDKPKVADDFVKNHVKEAKVDGSIFDFEGLEGLKRTKTIGKTPIDMSEFESIKPKAGFFTGLKEKAANAWSGIKSKFSNLTSKFKTSSANSAGAGSKLAGAKNWIKGMGGKIKNGLKAAPSKVGRFFKGKGGKWALVGLAAAAVTAAGIGIYKAVKGNSDNKAQETEGADKANKPAQPEKPQAKQTEEPPEEDPAKDEDPTKTDNKPTDKTSSDKKAGSTTGSAAAATTGSAQDPDKTDKTDKADKAKTKTDDETPDVPTVHTVVKGDNVWNIAKKHLQDINGKKPTNAEILKHTKELMEINGLEFEPDGKRVMIRPNDELKLIA